MKPFMILLAVITAGACHHSMAPWPYDGDKQNITLQVRTNDLTGFMALPQTCQLFVYNEATGTTARYSATTGASNNQYQASIYPGTYIGYCVTNAENEEYWDYEKASPPEEIYLKSQTDGGSNDHLLGHCPLQISAGATNSFTFDMQRKVGKLQVIVENIPEWLTDLKIELNNIPTKISLTGEADTRTHTVSCQAFSPVNGMSVTDILVFPPTNGKQSTLRLSSKAHAYSSEAHPINEIIANKITRINIIFKDLPDINIIDFATSIVEWDKDTIKEENWELPPPAPEIPGTGTGDGINLMANASFEEAFVNNLPPNWKLDPGGANKQVFHDKTLPHEGSCAVRLEGKTYLYQDIAISGGQCYQLKMFVNAPAANIKWRYWCTWMQGSTALNTASAALHPSPFQYQTNGYIDALNGQIFRAPTEATKLRMEIRTYTDPLVAGEGLLVDDVSVELAK